MKRIYISGPMTGVPDLNFPAFHAEAELAQTKQEPVAKVVICNREFIGWNPCLTASDIQKLDGQPLYTSPKVREPMSEDEIFKAAEKYCGHDDFDNRVFSDESLLCFVKEIGEKA